VRPRRSTTAALGVRARGAWGEASLGGYWMDFRDEIVYNGTLDDNGNPITGNAARSRHAGSRRRSRARDASARAPRLVPVVERPLRRLREYVDSTSTIDYSGNRIAGFPDVSGRLRGVVPLRPRAHRARRGTRGRQFLDNNEDAAASIEPWTVAHARVRLALPDFRQQADRGHARG
jgi:hypothetical protein